MQARARQKIRPSLIDLQDLGDDHDGNANGNGNELNWGPAATPFRRVAPPDVPKASASKAAGDGDDDRAASTSQTSPPTRSTKTVRIAPDSHNIVHPIQSSAPNVRPQPQRQQQQQQQHLPALPERFNVAFDDAEAVTPGAQDASEADLNDPVPGPSPFVPLIGGISERASLGASSSSDSSSIKPTSRPKGTSRFAAMRKLEGEAGGKSGRSSDSSITATGFPAVTHRQGRILGNGTAQASSVSVVERRATHAQIEASSRAAKGSSPGKTTAKDEGMEQEEEEWLDEKGQPMSAFRKSRLIKQGLQPPSKRKVGSSSTLSATPASIPAALSTDAIPNAGTDDLRGIAAENERKVKGMSREQVEAELEGVRDFFSPEVLEALKDRVSKRKGEEGAKVMGVTSSEWMTSLEAAAAPKNTPSQERAATSAGSGLSTTSLDPRLATPSEIRQRFFPSEPAASNSNIEWMLDSPAQAPVASTSALTSDASSAFRFDFEGIPLGLKPRDGKGTEDVERSRLMGLHNHGAEQDKPGYTILELLHLSRSTVAAQRVVALQTLGRIIERYPQRLPSRQDDLAAVIEDDVKDTSRNIAELIDELDAREQVCLTSRTFLNDKQLNVRRSALETLRKALWSVVNSPRTGREGQGVILGAVYQPLRKGKDAEKSGRLAQGTGGEVEQHGEMGKSNSSINALLQGLKRDLHRGLIGVGLLPALAKLVEDDWDTAEKRTSWIVDVLLAISLRDAGCAKAVAEERGLRDFIVKKCLRKTWPPQIPSDLPPPNSLTLVKVLLMSDRSVAQSLTSSTTMMEVLQRYVASPPFSHGVDPNLSFAAFDATSQVLGIYEVLTSYGMHSASISSSWSIFEPILAWCTRSVSNLTHLAAARTPELRLVENTLGLMGSLIVCATDPHELVEPHGINWSQVKEWDEVALAVVFGLSPSVHQDERFVGPLGEAVRMIGLWCKGVKKVEGIKRFEEKRSTIVDAARNLETLRQVLLEKVKNIVNSKEGGEEVDLDMLRKLSSATCHLSSLLGLQSHLVEGAEPSRYVDADTLSIAGDLVRSGHLDDFRRPLARAKGATGLARHVSNWLCLVAAHISRDPENAPLCLSILSQLSPGDESLALALLRRIVLSCPSDEDDAEKRWRVLRPFFVENLRVPPVGEGMLRFPPLLPEAKELKRTKSLVFDPDVVKRKGSGAVEGGQGEEGEGEGEGEVGEEDEVDPLSQAKLWKSPASGLPIRLDWTLAPLDDLLRSAESAALNRPGNLDDDEWDYNEVAIVSACLRVAVHVLGMGLKGVQKEGSITTKSREGLPSSSQVLLAITKVYMLEEVVVDAAKASGKVTGKDLFRDVDISKSIRDLFELANGLANLPSLPSTTSLALERGDTRCSSSTISTLEQAHVSSVGSGTPFFQLYTDLVGLYDAISFSDALFARTLLSPLSMRYARDYRRLLWSDYAHLLPTLRTKVEELPIETRSGLRDFLEPLEEGEEMLGAYLEAMGKGRVSEGGQPVLHRIALHHVAGAVWKGLSYNVGGGSDAGVLKVQGVQGEGADEEKEKTKTRKGEALAKSMAMAIFSSSNSNSNSNSNEAGSASPILTRLRRDVMAYDAEEGVGKAGPTLVGSRYELLRRLPNGERAVRNARIAFEGQDQRR